MKWLTSVHKPQRLVINGCFRSGTSLLDKLLHSHKSIIMASQPFPNLFFYMKELFLRERNITARYPLGHMFAEQSYRSEAFYEFLESRELKEGDINRVFDALASNAFGLQTPQILGCRSSIKPGVFLSVLNQFYSCLARILPKTGPVDYVGGKEAFIEEFVPFLLANQVKVIVIIRDPRDVISSVLSSTSMRHMGEIRPLLYLLRSWRKSVALAMGMQDHPCFLHLSFERLLRNTECSLKELTDFLNLEQFPDEAFVSGIVDQSGDEWVSNSSFGTYAGMNVAPIGRYSRHLDHETIAYIESVCCPEMRALGYDFCTDGEFSERALNSYREPKRVTHAKFGDCANYSSDPRRLEQEALRIRMLNENSHCDTSEEIERMFIFPGAFERLKSAFYRSRT